MKELLLICVVPLMLSNGVAKAFILPGGQHVPEEEVKAQDGDLWAVLVAGSNGWYNYRHQADICHAYQILHQHGVPDDHIIVMMYDDIAYNEENPDPGVIINHPRGFNVYAGILKDYVGEDVTPHNFLNVLKGNASAMAGTGSGKVVQSSRNDRIFINMVDHGAPGIFAFPSSYLQARELADAVLELHRERKFAQMVIYVEACESGSMFKNLLPDDVQIFALSASNPHEPSYACYMDERLNTYLGDVFSVKWMEDTDSENIHRETLKHQFRLVRKEVTTSTVMEWGEFDINKQKLYKFMGEEDHPYTNSIHYLADEVLDANENEKKKKKKKKRDDVCLSSAVASPDVPIAILKSRVRAAKDDDEKEHWSRELTTLHMHRLLVHVVMRSLVKEVTQNDDVATAVIMDDYHNITRWDCYERSVDAFHEKCFNLAENPYALRVLQMAVNLCEHGYSADDFIKAAEKTCVYPKFKGIQ